MSRKIPRLIWIFRFFALFAFSTLFAEELLLPIQGKWELCNESSPAMVEVFNEGGETRTVLSAIPGGHYRIQTTPPRLDFLIKEFQFQIYVPHTAPSGIEIIVHIKDVDFWWYQQLITVSPQSGEWNDFKISLTNNTLSFPDVVGKHSWIPKGHFRPFNQTATRRMREIGITLLIPDETSSGTRITGIALEPLKIEFRNMQFVIQNDTSKPELEIVNIEFPHEVPQYEKFEATFDLTRFYANPFDPGIIDVTAHVITPGGNSFDYPCFYFQNYQRSRDGDFEKLTPVGIPRWKLRIAPLEKGRYTWWITAKDSTNEASTLQLTFVSTESVSNGFVRVSNRDSRFFEFSDGTFFYPVGINLHCTYDDRYHNVTLGKGPTEVRDHPDDERKSRGGYIIDPRSYYHTEIFEKMSQNKMNATEIWLASWGYEIEWRDDWRGYAGINHYSMENAWRLDLVTESARMNDIYYNLVFHCHGQFADGGERGQDGEFEHHPYRRSEHSPDGFLRRAYDIFHHRQGLHARAFELLMKRMRYIVARYGYSRNIFSWEIISETDLTAARKSPESRRFVISYANRLKALDIHNHPVTNHYSGDYNVVDRILMHEPVMDFVSGDAYRGWVGHGSPFRFVPLYELLRSTSESWSRFNKPGLITELGACWFGGPEYVLYNDVHQLTWAGWITDLAGTSFFWWVEYIDDYDLYWHYRAFANYIEGEDKRGRNLVMRRNDISILDRKEPDITVASLTDRRGGYAWIYDIHEFDARTRTNNDKGIFFETRDYMAPEYTDVVLPIQGMMAGVFEVEFWDTYTGEIIDTIIIRSSRPAPEEESSSEKGQGATLNVPLPPFRKDIALKIRPSSPSRQVDLDN